MTVNATINLNIESKLRLFARMKTRFEPQLLSRYLGVKIKNTGRY